jgi:thymidine phosphorylase
VLEARDVMAVLRNDPAAPADLRDRALMLAGRVLEFDPALEGGAGLERARALLDSGQALAAMERIIDAQGRRANAIEVGALHHDVRADHRGSVAAIDCHLISRIARAAGAPMDKGAGIDLLRKVGDRILQGDILYRIHAESSAGLAFARELAEASPAYTVAP